MQRHQTEVPRSELNWLLRCVFCLAASIPLRHTGLHFRQRSLCACLLRLHLYKRGAQCQLTLCSL